MQNIEFLIAVVILSFLTYIAMRTPSHDRNWSKDQKVLPTVSFYGDFVTVHNMRQARYRSTTDYDMALSKVTFRLKDLAKAWLLIEPFGNLEILGHKAAHVLISFELTDGRYVSVSPEIRKKQGETFSALRSFIRHSEIMYVIADELDVIKLRTNYRKDTVRLYPLTLTPTRVQKLFKDMARKTNAIHAKAVFFNTIVHSCATNITYHLRRVGAKLPKRHVLYLLPSALDSLLYKQGLIDTELSLAQAREHFYITERAQQCASDEAFSKCIRSAS